MDYLIAQNSVMVGTGDTAPTNGTPAEATSGNPNATPAVPATQFPAYWANMIQREIRNAIVAAGLTPSGLDWTQLMQAMFIFASPTAYAFGSPGAGLWTPPANWTRCGCLVIGGGGAGGNGNGNSGGGGQAAGGAFGFLEFTAGSTIPYLVGGGGASSGAPGGTSSCEGLTGVGGAGGPNGSPGNAGTGGGYGGGQASGGLLQFLGGIGGEGFAVSDIWQGGQGGNSVLGQGGVCVYTDGQPTDSASGTGGTGFGAGGGGGVNAGAGGAGFGGLVLFFGSAAQ